MTWHCTCATPGRATCDACHLCPACCLCELVLTPRGRELRPGPRPVLVATAQARSSAAGEAAAVVGLLAARAARRWRERDAGG